jgi:3-hydroxymyristoyl/3-hydroxydecanoyl-(acyl carrier protein) dehydratase
MDLDNQMIQRILPHRFPFLLVDKVSIEKMTAVGLRM